MYKDPKSVIFPHAQIITGVAMTWILIWIIVIKRIQVLGSVRLHILLYRMSTLRIAYKDLQTIQKSVKTWFYLFICCVPLLIVSQSNFLRL